MIKSKVFKKLPLVKQGILKMGDIRELIVYDENYV